MYVSEIYVYVESQTIAHVVRTFNIYYTFKSFPI